MSPTLRRAVPLLVAAVVLAILGVVLGVVRPWTDPAADDSVSAGTGPGSDSPVVPPATGGGSSGSTGNASPPATPSVEPGPDDQQTRFTSVGLGADGATLDVAFWGGVDTCYRYTVRADEDGQAVALSLAEDRRTDGPCIDLAQEWRKSVRLDDPLGDRVVRDAATGEVVLDPRG